MQYELKIEDVSSYRRRLHFVLPGEEVKSELDAAFRDMKRRVRLPGFRKGKVPHHVLEARFGKQIRSDVTGQLVDRAWRQAMVDLDVAGQPALEETGVLKSGDAFTFSVGVDVRPQVSVQGYTDLEIEHNVPVVTEDDVERAIQDQLATLAKIEKIEEARPAQEGDFVLAEIDLTLDGELVVQEAGTLVNTAAERYYPGVETVILGMAVGDERTETITMGASFNETVAGKQVEARVKVIDIQAQMVPELTDEVAEQLGNKDGADAFRDSIRVALTASLAENDKTNVRVKILQRLVESNPIDVPQAMIDEQLNALLEELKVRRAYQGEDIRSIRFSEAEIEDLRGRALFAARSSVLLEGIARDESVDVSDADLDAKMEEIASSRGQTVEAIRGYLQREDAMGVLGTRIREEKTLDWLLEQAKLVPVSETPVAAEEPVVAEAPVAAEEPAAADEPVAAEEPAAAPTWNSKMKKAELLEIAKGLGLKVNTKNTKAEIIAALEAAQ